MTSANAPGEEIPEEPTRRRVGRPPTLDREAALRAARHVIARRGLNRTRYSDVAELCGIPVTSLQHSFGSLNAMLLESMHASLEAEINEIRQDTPAEGESQWQRLERLIGFTLAPPEDPDTWLVWVEFWALAGRDPEMGAKAGQVYARWWSMIEELIDTGIKSGEFQTRQSAADASVTLTALMDGLGAAYLMRADGPDYDTALRLAVGAARDLLGVDSDS